MTRLHGAAFLSSSETKIRILIRSRSEYLSGAIGERLLFVFYNFVLRYFSKYRNSDPPEYFFPTQQYSESYLSRILFTQTDNILTLFSPKTIFPNGRDPEDPFLERTVSVPAATMLQEKLG